MNSLLAGAQARSLWHAKLAKRPESCGLWTVPPYGNRGRRLPLRFATHLRSPSAPPAVPTMGSCRAKLLGWALLV